MNSFRLYNIDMLHLLWLLPLLLGIIWYGHDRRQRALAIFMQAGLRRRLTRNDPGRSRIKAALLLVGGGFLIAALCRPAWNEVPTTVKRAGRDVVFLVDVSRSMLAEDLAPNRLARAKLAIMDCVDQLRGDRVALVPFSGTAVIACPLTLDYGFFRLALDNLSPDSVSRGGTMIGDAIRTVLNQVLDSQQRKYKDIILITDGEDHESFPVEAAAAAADRGVRLLIVGLGDEHEGKRIPITDEAGRKTFLQYQGKEVWTKLDADTLRRMAKTTPGGQYLPVATGTFDLGEIYSQLIGAAEKKDFEEQTVQRYEEKFQIFLATALLLLVLEMLLAEVRKG